MSDQDIDFAAMTAAAGDFAADSEWRGDSPPALTVDYIQNPHNLNPHFSSSDQDAKTHPQDFHVFESAIVSGQGTPDNRNKQLLDDEAFLSLTQQPFTSSSESLFSSSQDSLSDISSKQTSMTALSSLVGRAAATESSGRLRKDPVPSAHSQASGLRFSHPINSAASPWKLQQQQQPRTAVVGDDLDMADEVLQTSEDAQHNLNYDEFIKMDDEPELNSDKENDSAINTEGGKLAMIGQNPNLYNSKLGGLDGRLHQSAAPSILPIMSESTIGSDFMSPYSGGLSPLESMSANSSPTYDDPTTSVCNTPPPFSAGSISNMTPNVGDTQQHRKGHNKAASRYSLSQSINKFNTAAAHDLSPQPNFNFGQAPLSQAFAPNLQFPFEHSEFLYNFWGGDGAGPFQPGSNMFPQQNVATGPNSVWQGSAMQQPQLTNGACAPMSATQQSLGTPLQLFTTPRPPLQFSVGIEPHKSRVETQIPVTILLSYLPPDITKLHLPPHTIAKPKLLAKNAPEHSPDTLELYTMVVRTSAMEDESNQRRAFERAAAATYGPQSRPEDDENEESGNVRPADGGEVWICDGCIQRERKRANRKKSKKPEDDEGWSRDEHRRIIIFNTNEIREWQPTAASLPPQSGNVSVLIQMRITCYCRHHGEKVGFRVIFTLKDSRGQVLAQTLSRSIMITDDHKTPTANPAGSALPVASISEGNASTAAVADIALSSSSATLAAASVCKPMAKAGKIKAQSGVTTTAELPATKRGSVASSTSDAAGSSGAKNYTFPAATASSAAAIARALSRPASPDGSKGHAAKKRKSSAGINTLPAGLTMTRIKTSPQAQQPAAQNRSSAGNRLAAASTSPVAQFSPSNAAYISPPPDYVPDTMSAAVDMALMSGGSGDPDIDNLSGIASMFTGPQVAGSLPLNSHTDHTAAHGSIDRSTSFDGFAPRFSAPSSRHPSRPSSPNGLRGSMQMFQQQMLQPQQQRLQRQLNPTTFPQQIQNSLLSIPSMAMPQPTTAPISQPVIHKIIPGEGPKSGGIEVTILGSSFYQGLDVMFGDQRATTTTFWGESSLVCLVPPSPISGLVPVTLSQSNQRGAPQSFVTTQQRIFFRYFDDDEQQLMRAALVVLSRKMTGRIEDAQDLARRIIGSENSNWGNSSGGTSGGGSVGNPNNLVLNSSIPNFETRLLKVLELIDLDDSSHRVDLNMRHLSTGGHSMLHLACVLGMHRFVAGLLARGADPDIRDNGGYTPLHLAALNNQPEIVRRLIHSGADPTMRTLSGLTASEVTSSRVVLRAIERFERHARSRSSGSLHTLASSAASLRSLQEPLAMTATQRRASFAVADTYKTEESAEDSTRADCDSSSYGASSSPEASSEQEEENDEEWLEMRPRTRIHSRSSISSNARHGVRDGSQSSDSLATSTAAAVAAAITRGVNVSMAQASPAAAAVSMFKDQLSAHFQQMVAQFPNIPSNPLPDYYQAYLNSAAFQRISSLVPNINIGSTMGSRPYSSGPNFGREDGVGDGKEFEGRWADSPSAMRGSALPPSYEEIFPHKSSDLDTKTATAAAAAAEAEADTKCSALYDNQHVEAAAELQATPTGAAALASDNGEVVEEEGETVASVAVLQIGRKHQITKEQQENFRRVHKEKRKGLSSDTFLYTVWIPILLGVLLLWLSGARAWDFLPLVKFNVPYATSLNSPARQTGTNGNNEKGTGGTGAGNKPILPPAPAEAVVRHNDGQDIAGAIAAIVA
ncbi:SPT3 Dosage dependent suppressor of Ty-induced promoter mutations-like protein [Sporothrix epigloea]|uniref:SPT3 Dosage dependent suppressor of Ty-induced promoter mutations-like protein n=1 Tax=Sporothrix epigloea TaxID=1892477 RepID=A0ABP0DWY2_9PEZI